MPIVVVGNFTVYKPSAGYADEMMLLTHGGTFPDGGMESLDMSVYFYSPHTVTITFDKAWDVIRGTGGGATSIAGPSSPVWNYTLETLRGNEGTTTLDAWNDRAESAMTKWDWWEVNGDERRDLKALKAALHTIKPHTYSVLHFLCCREWMGKNPPPAFGALKAPHK